MATMNWAQLHAVRNGCQNAYDELPRAGSHRDQIRYFKSNPARDLPKAQQQNLAADHRVYVAKALEGVRKAVSGMLSESFKNMHPDAKERFVSELKKKIAENMGCREFDRAKIVKTAKQMCGIPTGWIVRANRSNQ